MEKRYNVESTLTLNMKELPLAKTRPDLAKQFHPAKNSKIFVETISQSFDRQVWWLCEYGHEWKESPFDRSKQPSASCKICETSLASTNVKLLNLWHPTKNIHCTPYTITARSHKKVWWKCPVGDEHEWEAPPYNIARLKNTTGCPICRGFKVISSNCLATTHPDIALEWDYLKNGNLTPLDVTAGSGRKVHWKCSNGSDHAWISSIGGRTSKQHKGQGKCPYCQGQKVALSNSLATLYPDIASEWDSESNFNTPNDVTAGSSQKVTWICKTDSLHKWAATVHDRVNGTGCPYCKGKKASSTNCLAVLYPEVASEWDLETNLDTPYEVTAGSGRKANWICKKDSTHRWKSTIVGRVHGSGCPFCQGQQVTLSNCLATLYPNIANEWHPEANKKTPYDVTAGSNDKITWRCQKDATHIWEATVKNRVKGRGCSYCNLGWTVENIRHFVKSLINYLDQLSPAGLYVLFQQKGLLDIDITSKGRTFVEALKTGRFPKDELEKFINGSPSLVDQFLNTSISLEENEDPNLQASEKCLSENDVVLQDELPTIETKDILSVFDSKIFSNLDREAIDFFIKEAVARIWQHTFSNESEALQQLNQFNSDEAYPQEVKKLFLADYLGAKNLAIPNGYNFPYQPNLMQRYTAYLVKSRKRLGNWSGTGAGKTLSAILASRVIEANLTVICCPNNVIDNWARNILGIYPDSSVLIKDINFRTLKENVKNQYLILNYEFFQQPKAEARLKALLKEHQVDFVIIDEIHYSKQREAEKISDRKRVIASFLSEAASKNDNLHILGMSATPVINNLFEGKTLIELVTGFHHDDLQTKATVPNCISHYQKFVTYGIRWLPQYHYRINVIKEDVECSNFISEIKYHSAFGTMVDLEAILTKAKLPFILKHLVSKTVVYTHYTKNILNILQDGIEHAGWRVGVFTGENKEGLHEFLNGNVDILIASSCIGTGIDGLQHVSNRLIVNSLPWTHAEFEQLKGRLYRQGQKYDHVDIFVPLTFAEINGSRWSWCESRWKRIQFKKSIADAAVDGVIPEGHLRTPVQAYKDTMHWLERLEKGEIYEIERRKISIPLSDEIKKSFRKKFGNLSQMNSQINHEQSEKTHDRFRNNPAEWEHYHAVYREDRKTWPVIPYQEALKWFKARPHMVIGDFGCGEAFLEAELENKVISFDHIAINDNVVACDMSHIPLDDSYLDAAVFSLSLMGSNFLDYIKEAHRCLKLDGHLWIAEPTSRIKEVDFFKDVLFRLGFDVSRIDEKWKFTFIKAIKSERKINLKALESINTQDILG